jgi:hypothetical protein
MNADSDNCGDAARAKPCIIWLGPQGFVRDAHFCASFASMVKHGGRNPRRARLTLDCAMHAESIVMLYPPESLRPQVLISPMPACLCYCTS